MGLRFDVNSAAVGVDASLAYAASVSGYPDIIGILADAEELHAFIPTALYSAQISLHFICLVASVRSICHL
jgi:hypothetical protein